METGKRIAAGVLPICAKSGRILLARRGPSQPHPNLWACFGGKFEAEVDKNPKDTAKREFVEESRYAGKYKISSSPLYTNENNHSLFYTYVGIFDEEFIPDLEKGNEADSYGWFYLSEIPEELLPGFRETIEKKYDTIQNIICFYSNKC